ncbi:MAG TPA: hypothetical protein VM901_05165 [Bdellovibrionota bacterium]|jgi:hypothetical protein|nr:hypothetical protein [Bdellovibrionota bacterium]
MKRFEWKNMAGTAFFVVALLGTGLAEAGEKSALDPTQNMVCDCTRVAFNTPNCQIIKEQTFGAGGLGNGSAAHGMNAIMPQNASTQVPAQTQVK